MIRTRIDETLDAVFITDDATKLPTTAKSGTHKRMTEPAIRDLVRELDDPRRHREPELEVDIEVLDERRESIGGGSPAGFAGRAGGNAARGEDEALLDPWFLRTEEEFAMIEDDPSAQIHEIRIAAYDDQIWTTI